jgi:hypothetical protein
LNFIATHPAANHMTVCASTGSSCSDSGGANPKIVQNSNYSGIHSNSGRCVRFADGSGGYTIKNLDCGSTVGSFYAYDFDINSGRSVSDVIIEGGRTTNYRRLAWSNGSGGGAFANGIRFGTCTNRHEFSNPPTISGENAGFVYQSFSNSTFSLYIHDVDGCATCNDSMSHMIDIGTSGGSPQTGVLNFTVECSQIDYAGIHMGNFIKLARGSNATVQDSVFNVSVDTDGDIIGVGTHNGAGTEGIVGLTIRRNRFNLPGTSWGAIGLSNAQNVLIENNVAMLRGQVGGIYQRGFLSWQGNSTGNGIPLQNIAIRNNTVYRTAVGGTSGSGMINEAGGSVSAFSGASLTNNLFFDLGAGSATIITMGTSGCGGYGSGAANIRNNWVYTPNDSTPMLWGSSCTAATGANPSPYNQDPGLVDPANGNFALAPGSALAGRGIAASTLTTDIVNAPRPNPPSIGAYDLSSGGGTPALAPPVLIQVSSP